MHVEDTTCQIWFNFYPITLRRQNCFVSVAAIIHQKLEKMKIQQKWNMHMILKLFSSLFPNIIKIWPWNRS